MSEQVPDPSEQQASQKAEGQSRTDARPEATEQKKAADAPAERPAPKPARKAPRKAAQAARGSTAEHAGKPQAKTRRPQRKPAGNQPPRAKAPTKATPRPSDTGAGRKAGAPKASDTGTSTPKGKVTMPPAPSRLKKAAQGIKPPSLGTLRHPSTFAKVLMALVVIYVVGIVFFWSRFLPQTTVDGRDVSWRSVSSVTEELAQAATDYELKVRGERVAIQLNGDDIALAFDKKAFADAVAHPIQKFFWPLTSLFPRSDMAPGSVTFNDGTLRGITDAATEEANVEAAGSGNATVAYDAQSGRFVGVGESQGTAVDADTLHAQVSRAVATLQDALELDSSVLVKPTVTESDPRFPKALESAQDFPDLTIDLRLSNIVVETIEPDLVKSWLKVSDDYEIAANERAIEDWTRGDLSAKLDSVGALRTWERWDGKQIQVFDGTYGWNIDGAQLAQDIAARINDRSEVPIEVPCTQRAALYNPGGPDWGNRYIEVDLTEQYAYMYDEAGDLIWQSECVTGNESENDGTVTGVYLIEKKKSPETLIGLDNDGDGEPDYENEVEFWMPFYGGFGLHDALWRDSFDYDTYLTDGSHGCVNLPYYAAASLYELCEVGDPVVVHW